MIKKEEIGISETIFTLLKILNMQKKYCKFGIKNVEESHIKNDS